MSCEQSEQTELWMMDALDNVLATPDQRRLLAHLDHCAFCRSEWRALNAVEQMLSSQPLVYPKTGFVKRFEARLERSETQRRTLLGGMILMGAAAALCLLGVLMLLNGRNPIQVYGTFLWNTYRLLGHAAALGYTLLSLLWFTADTLASSVNIPLPNLLTYTAAITLAAIAWRRSMTSRRVVVNSKRNGY
jgi:hypothetical protein